MSVFKIIDANLHGIEDVDSDVNVQKVKLISQSSHSAYEHFQDTVGEDKSIFEKVFDKIGVELNEENFNQFIFHYGFQYGFSMQEELEKVTNKFINKMDEIVSKKDSGDIEITDELVANIVVDRENGYLQLVVGGRTITCKNIQSVDVIEV